jgi:chemotaxis protein MotB
MSRSAAKFSRDEGYYASMADLMAGMLFIFIIVAMVFAIDVRKDRVEAVAEAEAKTETRVKAELEIPATPLDRPAPVDTEIAVRARLVETIRDFLAARGVRVESEPREGLLRLPANLLFTPAGAVPLPAGQTAVSHLAAALDRWLPCLSNGAPPPDMAACAPFTAARLRLVRIEVHAEPGQRSAGDAESLTGARAVHLLSGLLGVSPHLLDLRNDAAERLLDIRGMGAQWPLEPAFTDAGFDAEKAEAVKTAAVEHTKMAPVKGGANKGQLLAKNEAPKMEAPKVEPPQPRSQRIDLRFDMVVPGTERPGQAGGLILRPTAK